MCYLFLNCSWIKDTFLGLGEDQAICIPLDGNVPENAGAIQKEPLQKNYKLIILSQETAWSPYTNRCANVFLFCITTL